MADRSSRPDVGSPRAALFAATILLLVGLAGLAESVVVASLGQFVVSLAVTVLAASGVAALQRRLP